MKLSIVSGGREKLDDMERHHSSAVASGHLGELDYVEKCLGGREKMKSKEIGGSSVAWGGTICR